MVVLPVRVKMGNVAMIEKVCPICGKTFIQKHNSQKYCSKACAKESDRESSRIYYQLRRGPITERICQFCGKSFKPDNRHQKYCKDCREKKNYYLTKNKKFPCYGYKNVVQIPIEMCLNCKPERCRYEQTSDQTE